MLDGPKFPDLYEGGGPGDPSGILHYAIFDENGDLVEERPLGV